MLRGGLSIFLSIYLPGCEEVHYHPIDGIVLDFCCISIYLSIYIATYISTYLSINLPGWGGPLRPFDEIVDEIVLEFCCISIYISIYISDYLFTYLSTRLRMSTTTLSTRLYWTTVVYIHISSHIYSYLSIYLSTYLSTYLSIYLLGWGGPLRPCRRDCGGWLLSSRRIQERTSWSKNNKDCCLNSYLTHTNNIHNIQTLYNI